VIERYTLPEIGAVWTEEAKYHAWLRVELAISRARAQLGEIPTEEVEELAEKADFTVGRIHEIEQQTNHDVIAFVTNVSEYAGDVARHFHFGLTSSDVLDTAGALQLREALDLILDEARALTLLLAEMALEHRDTVMIGRTHGVHAEPTVLGHKLAVWAFEMERNLDRLSHAREVAAVGKISGAVGTYANIDPKVEAITCQELGLTSSPASTQILQRDRHAEVLSALAILGSTMEKIALEIRGAQRTEVRELAEPFGRGQKGSSAMPHKRNPILAERLCSPTPRSWPSTCSAPHPASCAVSRSTRTTCSRT
jgi:adenylosuccinate lyase